MFITWLRWDIVSWWKKHFLWMELTCSFSPQWGCVWPPPALADGQPTHCKVNFICQKCLPTFDQSYYSPVIAERQQSNEKYTNITTEERGIEKENEKRHLFFFFYFIHLEPKLFEMAALKFFSTHQFTPLFFPSDLHNPADPVKATIFQHVTSFCSTHIHWLLLCQGFSVKLYVCVMMWLTDHILTSNLWLHL